MSEVVYKECCRCGVTKQSYNFSIDRSKEDKKSTTCKKCKKVYDKKYHMENRDMALKRSKEFRDNQRVNGLCQKCKNKALENQSHCEICWYKLKSVAHFGSVKMWGSLKELAEAQNFICVYTGERLSPGLNMSIDHIMPQGKYPKLKHKITNMQWVTRRINSIKRDQTHNEFIDMCTKIYLKFKKA